jgi:hypothetical protein
VKLSESGGTSGQVSAAVLQHNLLHFLCGAVAVLLSEKIVIAWSGEHEWGAFSSAFYID